MFEHEGSKDRLYGKYPGVVVDNQPPSGGARFQGEVKVRVSSILDDASRPIEAWAKPCFHPGFFFIPEVGDLVWVEFVAGDIDFPIWSGVWYAQGNTPQTTDDQAPVSENKIVRTAAGHVIQLDDVEGQEAIAITHSGGAVIRIDENGSVLIANQNGSFASLDADNGELTLGEEHGNLVTLGDNGILLANQGSKITIELKDGKLSILSQEAVDIMAPKVNLHSGSINLGGSNPQQSVMIGGAMAVHSVPLGEVLMAMYNAHTHPTALGPSGPPVPPLLPTALSQNVKVRP